jgi:vitamin B12 transporter
MRKILLAGSAFLFLNLTPALAGNETIIVTATGTPQNAATIPASVTVIDQATIMARGYTTLADALADVPGLHIVQLGGPGAQTSVFLRGAQSYQVLVLRDGVPVNDPSDPNGAFDFGLDALSDVDHIEIVRGPMSSVYGSSAIGGVINIISKKPNNTLSGDVTLAGGYPRALLANGDISGRSGIWDFVASAGTASDRGFDPTPQRETTIYTNTPDGYRQNNGQLELGVTPLDDTRFYLLLRGHEGKGGGTYQGFDGSNTTAEDASLLGKFGIATKFFDGAVDSAASISRINSDRRDIVTLASNDPTQSASHSSYHAASTDATLVNSWHVADLSDFTTNAVTLDYGHLNETARSNADYSSPLPAYLSQVAAHADTDQIGLGITSKFASRLDLSAQLRQDWTSLAGDAATYRLGAVLELPEIASRLHAAYGTSFRAPAVFDRYGTYSDGYYGSFVGNPTLKPEHGEGEEIGFSHDWNQANGARLASLSVTGFASRTRDLMTNNYAYPVATEINIGSAMSHGVETELTVTLTSFATLDFSYTLLDAENADTHRELLRRPRHSGSAILTLTPTPNITITPQLRYAGDHYDVLYNNFGTWANDGYSRGGLIFDLTASYKLQKNWSLFVSGKNLADSHDEPANGYQIPGPSFLAGVRAGY